jgi:hypothetical protein
MHPSSMPPLPAARLPRCGSAGLGDLSGNGSARRFVDLSENRIRHVPGGNPVPHPLAPPRLLAESSPPASRRPAPTLGGTP